MSSLNEVTANNNRGRWWNSWGFSYVAITISKKRCKQGAVVY